jgi:error-prone DNA polymerase
MRVELNAASAFSFLRIHLPEDLGARSARIDPSPSSIGGPGRAAVLQAAGGGVRPIVGADLTLAGGDPCVAGGDRAGYRSLCRLISEMKRGVPKGEGARAGDADGRWRASWLPASSAGIRPDTSRLARLLEAFGPGQVVIDVQRHRRRPQEAANQALLDLADASGLHAIATNGVRHARAPRRALLDVLTCIREKRTLADAGRLLAVNAERHLKSPKQMWRLFADRPTSCATRRLADRLRFTLRGPALRVPGLPAGPGRDDDLDPARETEKGARKHYGPTTSGRARSSASSPHRSSSSRATS